MTPEIKNRIDQIRRGKMSKGVWTKAKLSEISIIITGSTPLTVNTEAFNGNNLFITPSDFQAGKYIIETIRHLSDSIFETSRIIPANSIYVVCIGATIGKINMCQREATCNQQINAVVPNSEVDSEFLYYDIDYTFNREKKRYTGEQALPIVNKSTFSGLLLNIPSFSEQKKIAKILSAQDKVIELKENLIAEKQRQKNI